MKIGRAWAWLALLALVACRSAARPHSPLEGPSGLEEITIVARGLE